MSYPVSVYPKLPSHLGEGLNLKIDKHWPKIFDISLTKPLSPQWGRDSPPLRPLLQGNGYLYGIQNLRRRFLDSVFMNLIILRKGLEHSIS
jgi:hypothetical protein